MKRYRFYFCISEETQNFFSPKAHHKRLCSSSKAVRSSLNFFVHPPTLGFVLETMDTLAWAANIKYNASNHLEVTMVGTHEHAN
jgi:hypothetical protein